jgi:alpha-1,6-mannosyltransferase
VIHESPDVLEVSDKYSLCYLAGLLRRLWRASDRPTLVGLSCERLDDNVGAHLGPFRHDRALCQAYLGRVYIGMFDAHIANSEYTADELRAAMVAPHRRPIHVCSMGVHLPSPLTAAERVSARRDLIERIGGADVPVILYAGRVSPEKNVAVLPAVMAALIRNGSPTHLVIAGDGPLREWLTATMRAAAPGRAHFTGHIADPRTLARYVAVSDVFLHPNPREPFGIAPLEAMAAGTPLVAPDAGGVRSYATCDNAWLASAEPESLAAAVTSVLRGGDDKARKLANAELTARQFVWPAAASRIFETYERVHAARVSGRTTGHHAPGGAVGVLAR